MKVRVDAVAVLGEEEVVRLACCAANLMELVHVDARRFRDSWLAGDCEDLSWGVLVQTNQSEQK